MAIIFIAVCAFVAYRARKKGYEPVIWFFAGGLIGLLILAFLPFTTREDLPHYNDKKMISKGNAIGAVVALISIVVIIIQAAGYYKTYSGL